MDRAAAFPQTAALSASGEINKSHQILTPSNITLLNEHTERSGGKIERLVENNRKKQSSVRLYIM